MARALARLPVRPDEVLVDGKPIATLGVPHHAVVGGDARCYTIGCASIVAKVVRDRLMARLGAPEATVQQARAEDRSTAAASAGARAAPSATARARQLPDARIQIDEGFDRAWRTVGAA